MTQTQLIIRSDSGFWHYLDRFIKHFLTWPALSFFLLFLIPLKKKELKEAYLISSDTYNKKNVYLSIV